MNYTVDYTDDEDGGDLCFDDRDPSKIAEDEAAMAAACQAILQALPAETDDDLPF